MASFWEYTEYVINHTYNRSKPEVDFHSIFSSIVAFLSARESVNVDDCYSAMCQGVTKIYSEIKLKVVLFLRAGHISL